VLGSALVEQSSVGSPSVTLVWTLILRCKLGWNQGWHSASIWWIVVAGISAAPGGMTVQDQAACARRQSAPKIRYTLLASCLLTSSQNLAGDTVAIGTLDQLVPNDARRTLAVRSTARHLSPPTAGRRGPRVSAMTIDQSSAREEGEDLLGAEPGRSTILHGRRYSWRVAREAQDGVFWARAVA